MKQIPVGDIDIPQNYFDLYDGSDNIHAVIVVPTPSGKWHPVCNLHLLLKAVLIGHKTVNCHVLAQDDDLYLFLKQHPVVPREWNEVIIMALNALKIGRASGKQKNKTPYMEEILQHISKVAGMPIEDIKKLDWIRREGTFNLIIEVMSGKDLDEAIDELSKVAA